MVFVCSGLLGIIQYKNGGIMKGDILLKDLYRKIRDGSLTEYKFKEWLSYYAHKNRMKGFDECISLEESRICENCKSWGHEDEVVHTLKQVLCVKGG